MREFIASDGARLAYDDLGEGRPIVFLHGFMANRGFFEAQRELADAFRLIAIDLRGHGDSAGGGTAPSLARLGKDVAELVLALDLRGAVGVGWSMGASVLWHLLESAAGDRFAGAVVVDMTPRVLNTDDWDLGLSREACDARAEAIRTDFGAFAANAAAAIFAQPLAEDWRRTAAWAAEAFASNDPPAMEALWSSLVGEDFRPRLGKIRQPTLIIHGARSHLYDAGTAEHLAQAIPQARAVRFEHSGHAPHMEQPELFNRTIRDFAASLPRTPVNQNEY